MPIPTEGSLAAKLKAATNGRDFPKALPAVGDASGVSGNKRPDREKRRAKHERREREAQRDSGGVSGSVVHTRGRFVRTEPIMKEGAGDRELQEAKQLLDEIIHQGDVLSWLGAFAEANGYEDADGDLVKTVTDRLERANRTMLPLKEGGAITSAEVDNLRDLLAESVQDITDIKEALEELESQGELALSPEVKALLKTETKPLISTETTDQDQSPASTEASGTSAAGSALPAPEGRPYASFGTKELHMLWQKQSVVERIGMVMDQLGQWKEFDQSIREFKDEGRLREDLKERVSEKEYDRILRLTERSGAIATRLKELRKISEERGELDQKEESFLKAIFLDYHDLLVVAERIIAECERETPIIEREKEAQVKEQRANVERVSDSSDTLHEKKSPFEEKVSRLKILLDQWTAWEQEFGAEPLRKAVRGLRRLKKRGVLPPVEKISIWFAEHTRPGAWQGKAAAADRVLLVKDALPSMENLIRDGHSVTRRLRQGQERSEMKISPSDHQKVEYPKVDGGPHKRKGDEEVERVMTMGGRAVVDGELTEWGQMDPAEQNRIRRELFARKDRFVSGLSQRLKQDGVAEDDRRRVITKYLDEYLPKMIAQVVTFSLQETDRESLMRDLKKEIVIT